MKGSEMDFCRGCKYEYDLENCPNKSAVESACRKKDGTMEMGYCKWRVESIYQNYEGG